LGGTICGGVGGVGGTGITGRGGFGGFGPGQPPWPWFPSPPPPDPVGGGVGVGGGGVDVSSWRFDGGAATGCEAGGGDGAGAGFGRFVEGGEVDPIEGGGFGSLIEGGVSGVSATALEPEPSERISLLASDREKEAVTGWGEPAPWCTVEPGWRAPISLGGRVSVWSREDGGAVTGWGA